MSRRIRTLLFTFFVLLFVVAAPSLAFYAQGYRLNWPLEPGKKLIVKTGAFFIKVAQKQANVYVNGKLDDQTDFFFGSSLMENFLPRTYLVEVKKQGYQTWQKNLDIREKEVTEARNIFLFPEHLAFMPVEKNASSTIASPDGTKIALKENDDNGWNLKIYDTSKGVISELAEESDFSAKGAEFSKWFWNDDSKTLDITVTINKTETEFMVATDKNPARISKNITATATSTEEVVSEESGPNKFYVGRDGYIYRKDFAGITTKINNFQIAIDNNAKYRLWVFGDYYFVAKNSELYILKPGADSLEKILDGLSAAPKLSPDGEKVVLASDSEIWVFMIKGKMDQPAASAGDRIFIARLSEKITDVDWFNSDYLVFTAGGAVKTSEIDNRDRVNIVQLAKFSDIDNSAVAGDATLVYNDSQKSAYLFLGNTLYKSQPIQ